MYMKHDLKRMGSNSIYLRPVAAADLPDDIRAQAGDAEVLFAVHNTKGEQVALVANTDVAVHLAAANKMNLVPMH